MRHLKVACPGPSSVADWQGLAQRSPQRAVKPGCCFYTLAIFRSWDPPGLTQTTHSRGVFHAYVVSPRQRSHRREQRNLRLENRQAGPRVNLQEPMCLVLSEFPMFCRSRVTAPQLAWPQFSRLQRIPRKCEQVAELSSTGSQGAAEVLRQLKVAGPGPAVLLTGKAWPREVRSEPCSQAAASTP